MMRQAELGCRVDGGGVSSDPHEDAQTLAHALAVLPEGRPMAIRIAELARSGLTPNWYQNEPPRIFPYEMHTNRWGEKSKTSNASGLGKAGWEDQPRRNRKGVVVYDAVKYTPCVWYPSSASIARAKRDYLSWWGALLGLMNSFHIHSGLTSYIITDEMPDMTPWKKSC